MRTNLCPRKKESIWGKGKAIQSRWCQVIKSKLETKEAPLILLKALRAELRIPGFASCILQPPALLCTSSAAIYHRRKLLLLKKKKKKSFRYFNFCKKRNLLPKGKQTLESYFFADNSTTRSSREGDVSWVRWKPERKMSATGKETAAKS